MRRRDEKGPKSNKNEAGMERGIIGDTSEEKIEGDKRWMERGMRAETEKDNSEHETKRGGDGWMGRLSGTHLLPSYRKKVKRRRDEK